MFSLDMIADKVAGLDGMEPEVVPSPTGVTPHLSKSSNPL